MNAVVEEETDLTVLPMLDLQAVKAGLGVA